MARSSSIGRVRAIGVAVIAATIAGSIALAAGASSAAVRSAAVVKPPSGAGAPVATTGIGTKAAMESPNCTTGNPDQFTVYGRVNSSVLGGGPICVKPWKAGDDNGGPTYRGVTKDSITVVALVPPKGSQQATANTDRTNGSSASDEDAFHDLLLPMMQYVQTWGRDIHVEYVTATGTDETAQRADALAVL